MHIFWKLLLFAKSFIDNFSDAAGAVLTSAEYPVYALADEQNLVASFPETRTGFQDQELVISLEAEGITPDVELLL